jgi:RNA polymerase sigma-70 factor, ECF subfamily
MRTLEAQTAETLPEKKLPPDDELIEKILAGETLLFAVLVKRYNQRLYRIVRAITHDDAEAEDIVQHAHLTAYRSLQQLRGSAHYATWLTKIAVNEALGRMRREKRHHLILLEHSGGDATMSTPEEDLYRQELARLLEHHIDELPSALRVVFVMRDVEELDTAETAATLGISEAAVRVRLHRARQALQGTLSEAMTAAPDAFHFAGERCDRMTRAVLTELGLDQRGL